MNAIDVYKQWTIGSDTLQNNIIIPNHCMATIHKGHHAYKTCNNPLLHCKMVMQEKHIVGKFCTNPKENITNVTCKKHLGLSRWINQKLMITYGTDLHKLIDIIQADQYIDIPKECHVNCEIVCKCRRTAISHICLTDKARMSCYNDMKESLEHRLTEYNITPLSRYIFDRLLSMFFRNMQDDQIEHIIDNDQEFNGFYIRFDSLLHKIHSGFTIQQFLNWEYPHPFKAEFENVIQLDAKDIIIPNRSHYDQCTTDDLYQHHQGIVCIVRKTIAATGDKYYLVDGYHRLASVIKRGDSDIDVILLSIQ
jgi:hypothetical protein